MGHHGLHGRFGCRAVLKVAVIQGQVHVRDGGHHQLPLTRLHRQQTTGPQPVIRGLQVGQEARAAMVAQHGPDRQIADGRGADGQRHRATAVNVAKTTGQRVDRRWHLQFVRRQVAGDAAAIGRVGPRLIDPARPAKGQGNAGLSIQHMGLQGQFRRVGPEIIAITDRKIFAARGRKDIAEIRVHALGKLVLLHQHGAKDRRMPGGIVADDRGCLVGRGVVIDHHLDPKIAALVQKPLQTVHDEIGVVEGDAADRQLDGVIRRKTAVAQGGCVSRP